MLFWTIVKKDRPVGTLVSSNSRLGSAPTSLALLTLNPNCASAPNRSEKHRTTESMDCAPGGAPQRREAQRISKRTDTTTDTATVRVSPQS